MLTLQLKNLQGCLRTLRLGSLQRNLKFYKNATLNSEKYFSSSNSRGMTFYNLENSIFSKHQSTIIKSSYLNPKASSVTLWSHKFHHKYNFSTSCRCQVEEKKPNKLELMDTPLVVTPSIITTIQNYFIYFFFIPQYDKDFTIQDFCKHSIKALEIVTNKLSNGMLEELKGLFTDDCLTEISSKFPSLTLKERHHLLILEERIQLYFPFLIKFIHKNDRVFLEVSMCYYMYYGERTDPVTAEPQSFDPMKFVFANCRFIREYTLGVEDNWTINYLNYGYSNQILNKPADGV